MHLAGVDFRAAVAWLERAVAAGRVAVDNQARHCSTARAAVSPREDSLRLPLRDDRRLGPVRQYLTECRHLSAALLEPLFESDRLYADPRGNAVFLMVRGKAAASGGRGTPWHGTACVAWDGTWQPQGPGVLLGR